MAAGRKTGGRKKGTLNKDTRELTDMIDAALGALGGVDYLIQQGRDQPVAFMGLLGKRLPREISADIRLSIFEKALEEIIE